MLPTSCTPQRKSVTTSSSCGHRHFGRGLWSRSKRSSYPCHCLLSAWLEPGQRRILGSTRGALTEGHKQARSVQRLAYADHVSPVATSERIVRRLIDALETVYVQYPNSYRR